MPTFVEWLHQLAPTWMQGPGGTAMTTAIGSELDRATDLVRQAVKARFPGLAPIDGLKKLGEERGIPKADWESDGDYAAYLVRAWDAWQGTDAAGGGAGTPASILIAVHRLLGGGFALAQDLAGDPQAAALVQWNGRFVQLYRDFRTPIFGWLDGLQTRIAGGSWKPTDLGSTLKLWLRADMGRTLSGSNVVTWGDQSGNGNNVTGSVPTNYSSVNGMPALTFSGTGMTNSTSSIIDGASPRTIVVICKPTGAVGSALTIRLGTLKADYPPGFSFSGTNLIYTDGVNPGNNAAVASHSVLNTPLVAAWQSAGPGTVLSYSENGVPFVVTQSSGSSTDNGTTGFSVGGSGLAVAGFTGDIAEVIVCDSVLSDSDAAKLYDYLYLRYRIGSRSALLPAPGWFDGTSYWARSWLVLPTPGGVITKIDEDGTILALGNEAGNVLKARLNAEVMKWKGARENYGGAYVTDSYNPRRDSGAPLGSDLWWVAQSAPVSYMLGWPPTSLDSNNALGPGYVLDGISSLRIDPP